MAVSRKQSLYEGEKGQLICAFHFELLDSGNNPTGVFLQNRTHTLFRPDTGVNMKNVERFVECFGWDGTDPTWLETTDLSDRVVEVKVENKPDLKGVVRSQVAFINLPGKGRGGEMPTSIPRDEVLRKYGTQFKAASASIGRKPSYPTATKKEEPPKPAPVVEPPKVEPPADEPPQVEPPAAKAEPLTRADAWKVCKEVYGGNAHNVWKSLFARHYPDKDTQSLDAKDWENLITIMQDQPPF